MEFACRRQPTHTEQSEGGVTAARTRIGRAFHIVVAPVLLAGCATAPLDEAGSLTSYTDLAQVDGLLTRSRLRISKDAILAAKTVRVVPTVFAESARQDTIADDQRKLIANAVDRSLCIGLSERFRVVSPSEAADLRVHAVVAHMAPTDEKAVAVTKVASVAKSVLLPGIPVPTPRIPIGLGSLSMEAEARGPDGEQRAAMVWARGANALFGSARVSTAGDAYELASAFGDDFSKFLVTGESPFKRLSGPPSMARLQSMAGGAPKYVACEAFGREPGVVGLVGGAVGLPPEWTDKGSAAGVVSAAAE